MRIRHAGRQEDDVELQMTPMIDIVFQLLIFFIMTFNPVDREGDFNIMMPQRESGPPPIDLALIVTIKLIAHDDGRLQGIRWGEERWLGGKELKKSLSGKRRADEEKALFRTLRLKIRKHVNDDTGPGSLAEATEVVLDCDFQLKYKHAINAITHISGRKEGGETIKLVEKIKFSRPDSLDGP